MKSKDYQRPTMKAVKLQHKCHIMAGSRYETTGVSERKNQTSIMEMEDVEDL